MTDKSQWVALVTFERCDLAQDLLPDWALGAAGWMFALAYDEDDATEILTRDITQLGLRVVTISEQREVFDEDDIEELDEHLAENVRNLEPGKQTVWGTIHCYLAGGEA